jgi:hypothetical protein
VEDAGLEILEARITYLAYAPEIAAVMLQRQQASAIIDARKMIMDGAVDDFRSINGQIEFLLTECVRQRKKTGKYLPDHLADSEDTGAVEPNRKT